MSFNFIQNQWKMPDHDKSMKIKNILYEVITNP